MANPNNLHAVDLAERTDGASAPTGPRKLVRPRLAEQGIKSRFPQHREEPALLAHHGPMQALNCPSATHSELFYFQKQMQAQTPMVFVLDDGERIEGIIEWYDQHVIKVRHTTRTLIYKSSIKYLFKASETASRVTLDA